MFKLIIIYGTCSHNTEFMAKAIAEGVTREGVDAVLKNAMMPAIRNFLNEINDIDLKGKVGLAFGSYGWGMEAINGIHNKLSLYGLELIQDFGVKRRPGEEQLEECRKVGSWLASRIKNKALMYPDIHNNLNKGCQNHAFEDKSCKPK